MTSGAAITQASKSAPAVSYKASVKDWTHSGSFVMGVADANLAVLSASSTAYTISGVGTPDRVHSTGFTFADVAVYAWVAPSAIGTTCTLAAAITGLTLTGGTITSYSFTPVSVNARGYDSGNTMLTISFTTINAIPVGG
jgi:hypothetical protein